MMDEQVMDQQKLELEKYKVDKRAAISEKKLENASTIIVGNFDLMQLSIIAEKFADSGNLIPPEYQGQPNKCFAAIYKGAAIGLDAFASLQRISVINGRATIWGDTALSLVRRSPLCEYVKEKIIEDEGKLSAICIVKRKGEDEHTEIFTQDDAIKAGLWGKSGTWKTHPKRMLKYKARAFALRDIFPDVIDGLYIAQEMEGENITNISDNETPKDVTPKDVNLAEVLDTKDQSQELFDNYK